MTDNLGIGNVSKNASVSDPNDSSLVSDGTSGNRISHAAHANGAFAKTSRPELTGSIITHSYQNMHLNRHRAPGRARWATEASGPAAPTPPSGGRRPEGTPAGSGARRPARPSPSPRPAQREPSGRAPRASARRVWGVESGATDRRPLRLRSSQPLGGVW